MKTFEKFKTDFSAACKKQSACQEEFKKLFASENWQELLTVIKNNANWCYTEKVIDADILSEVPDTELLAAGIYVKKENIVQREGMAYYYSSTSKHYDSSTSEHYGSSTSKHYGSSTSKHYDSSTSKHYDSSYDTQSIVNIKSINDQAVVRERSTGKIYF